MKRHSVLVVDDDAGVRSLYVDALEESGHRVAIAIASPARDKPFAADELNALVRGSCRLHRGSDDGDRAG